MPRERLPLSRSQVSPLPQQGLCGIRSAMGAGYDWPCCGIGTTPATTAAASSKE
ncbi:hypothetical protein LG3211_3389 [Lysobacter gummosus]|nr:hypothetical protein LG3211_3389 [Lysobacter gummosus]